MLKLNIEEKDLISNGITLLLEHKRTKEDLVAEFKISIHRLDGLIDKAMGSVNETCYNRIVEAVRQMEHVLEEQKKPPLVVNYDDMLSDDIIIPNHVSGVNMGSGRAWSGRNNR